MRDAQLIAGEYVALWNQRDPGLRRDAIARLWNVDGWHHVKTLRIQGYDALEARVTGSHEKNVRDAGYVFRACQNAERSAMSREVRRWATALLVIAAHALGAAAGAQPQPPSARVELGRDFVSSAAEVNGTTLHYVRGGRGPAVLLLHGFPQDWHAFEKIMSSLSRRFRVVVPDMRGVGGSAQVAGGYDIETLARDVRELCRHLELDAVYVVGHDNGGMIAYAVARLYPELVRGVMIFDVPLPGIEPWDRVKSDPALWHFAFHQTPDLPERLIAGREFVYFRSFFDRLAGNRNAISDAEVSQYAAAYAAPEQLRAGLEFYRRGYPSSEALNAAHRERIDVPIVLAGGDRSVAAINPIVAESLRTHGWTNVTLAVIENSGHWVVDEQPARVAELVERYASGK